MARLLAAVRVGSFGVGVRGSGLGLSPVMFSGCRERGRLGSGELPAATGCGRGGEGGGCEVAKEGAAGVTRVTQQTYHSLQILYF